VCRSGPARRNAPDREHAPGGEKPRVRDASAQRRDPRAVSRGSPPLASVVCWLTEPQPDPSVSEGHAQTLRPNPRQSAATSTPANGSRMRLPGTIPISSSVR
jgi:hypothetical protein